MLSAACRPARIWTIPASDLSPLGQQMSLDGQRWRQPELELVLAIQRNGFVDDHLCPGQIAQVIVKKCGKG